MDLESEVINAQEGDTAIMCNLKTKNCYIKTYTKITDDLNH